MVETPLIKNKTSITEWGPDSGGRQKGVTIIKPVIYGNIARALPDKIGNHTHKWWVYVKPYKNEEMTFIKKISFKLHESYGANAERVLTQPPYEIEETGWGEFELSIKIHFVDPNERPVTIYHQLKLFDHDPNNPPGQPPPIDKTKTVVAENYDEIVFQDPSLMMSQILNAAPKPFQNPPYRHEVDFEKKAEKTISDIAQSKKKVRAEITVLKDRLKKALEVKGKLEEQRNKMNAA